MKFKHLTYEDYKIKAENFLKANPFGIGKIPINIELLIEKSGIIIEVMDDLKNDYSVKGFVAKDVKNEGKVKIIIDTKHYENDDFEYKFTLAEELGHILLHMDFYQGIKNVDDYMKIHKSISDDDYRRFEQQARNIASFLLLPQEEFNDFVLEWVKKKIEFLKNFKYESVESFADIISRGISREIVLSYYVIYITILNRYPDRIIDNLVEKYGKELKL
jgi:Zn-dependent peptidase ImmA (M78 family)